MSKSLRLILILGFFAVMLVYCVAGLYLDLADLGSGDAWQVSGDNVYGEYYVASVDPTGPAKDLLPGDRIVAINGLSIIDHPRALAFSEEVGPGTSYAMTVQRGNQQLTFNLQTIRRPPAKFPWSRLVPSSFWLAGLVVFLLKPDDHQARLLALMLGTFSNLAGGGLRLAVLPDWLALLVALSRIAGLFALPLLLHLFLVFPHRSPLLQRWPSLTRWIYLPLLLVLVVFGLDFLPYYWSQPIILWPPLLWVWQHGLYHTAWLCVLAYLLAALVCFRTGYVQTCDRAHGEAHCDG